MDCFRTWETLCLGSIPNVTNSNTLWPLFRESPVLVVNEGEENSLSEQFLREFKPPRKSKKFLLADYWRDRVNSFKN